VINKKIVHQQYFDLQSETWDKDQSPENVVRLKKIFSELPFDMGINILDLGCGTGVLVPIINKNRHRFLVECDISKKMLSKNRLKWKAFSSKPQYLNGNAEKLPIIN